ncbi:unnamed protein product [Dovyalis caffra]|uniref:Uncharacterized protein n=1 Tax=Dovyalis caffra TaxID=77055 RepID=A0AAV1RIL0_9ROSI|nr:unnamed protein product [Dovyalis caffra]
MAWPCPFFKLLKQMAHFFRDNEQNHSQIKYLLLALCFNPSKHLEHPWRIDDSEIRNMCESRMIRA